MTRVFGTSYELCAMMVKVMLVIELIEVFYIFEYEFKKKIIIIIILKFYSLILEAKLPINHVKVFFFFKKVYRYKKFDKTFHTS